MLSYTYKIVCVFEVDERSTVNVLRSVCANSILSKSPLKVTDFRSIDVSDNIKRSSVSRQTRQLLSVSRISSPIGDGFAVYFSK